MPLSYIFKKCPNCGYAWKSREEFLRDRRLTLIGYQANFDILRLGILLFNHDCGTTLSLHVEGFSDLYKGPVYTERKTGGPECLGYCLRRRELRPCPAKCECAWVREIVQTINQMKTP